MRLLLIEDERTLCDAVARRLRRSGYSVDLAYDGERALQLLEVERYDLVLLDLNLPMGVVDNASDENNENTRRKATVVPIKIEYV